jgi:CheY-like chemotaxis protein
VKIKIERRVENTNTICVLFSEHDPDDQFIFKKAFEEISKDIELRFVYNDKQLLDFMLGARDGDQQWKPDIILADIKPPFFKLPVLKQIKTHIGFDNVPVYLFAENYYMEETEKVRESGAEDIYCKPNSLKKLKKILETILEKESNRLKKEIPVKSG